MYNKEFEIPLLIYRVKLKILICDDEQTAIDRANYIYSHYSDGETTDSFKSAASTYEIYLDECGYQTGNIIFNSKWLTAGTIAHEASHMTEYIFKLIGAEHNEYTSEFYSYTLGYIINAINKEVNLEAPYYEK